MAEVLRYDHYKVLGVSREATSVEVKRAFRARVKACHPDVSVSPRAATVFHAVHEAYRTLIDPELRRRYDDRLRFYRDATGTPPNPAGHKRRDFSFMQRAERPAGRMDIWAFRGLHLTGLLFGTTLTLSILIGLVFFEWPGAILALSIIGVGIIPDSLAGLKAKVR